MKARNQRLADEISLVITVCHCPLGTSKWNKIEHRLFAFITQNWRGQLLVRYVVILSLIAATTAATGLTSESYLDTNLYPDGIKVSDDEMAILQLERDPFHGEWNYTIRYSTPQYSKRRRYCLVHVQEMTAMVAPAFLTILHQIYDALDGSNVHWVVTGSFGFVLQGLPIEPHDIDIQTDTIGAYEMARRLATYVVRPVAFVESARIRSHLGGLYIDGIPVEIMGDIRKRSADGFWEPPVDLERHRREVEIGGMQIPVLSLTYEREAYRTLGRIATVNVLDAWLEAHPDAGD